MSKSEIVPGSVIGAVSRCHSPSLPKLIALCAVLQRMNGIEAFALDGRAVADVLRISKNTVYRNIQVLIECGILERIEDGNRREHRAAEFIYLPAFERSPRHTHTRPTRRHGRSGRGMTNTVYTIVQRVGRIGANLRLPGGRWWGA